jgi:large subunit ribosomal protein L29
MAAGTKPAELRELAEEDLVDRLREAKAELFNLRVQGATGQLDNNRRLQVIRREIARIYTIMRERELGLSTAPSDEVSDDEVIDDEVVDEVVEA